MAAPDPVKDAVLQYRAGGLSIIPVNGTTKTPQIKDVIGLLSRGGLTDDEVNAYFHGNGTALALACGSPSAGLGCIDFDFKSGFVEAWKANVSRTRPDLLKKVVVQSTQNAGKHVAFRVAGGNFSTLKLAYKAVEVSGPGEHEYMGKTLKAVQVDGKWFIAPCYIETRGEGGYFLAAPSRGYKLLQGDFLNIPVLSEEEVQVLLDAARELDEWGQLTGHNTGRMDRRDRLEGEVLPGDAYNAQASMSALLTAYGWRFDRDGGTGKYGDTLTFWTRPGKSTGISAQVAGDKSVHVFSSNALPLEEGKSYDCFGVFARYSHGGDYAAAAAGLREAGIAGVSGGTEDFAELLAWGGGDADPIPLPEVIESIPDLDPEMCPPGLREFWRECASTTRTPLEYAAAASIVALSASVGRRIGVTPNEVNKEWTVVPNLWGGIIGRPSARKTPAMNKAVKPLQDIEREYAAALEMLKPDLQADRKELELKVKEAEQALRSALKASDDAAVLASKELLAGANKDLEECQKKLIGTRLITSDSTTEKLLELMAVNPAGLLAHRDELTGLIKTLDKSGREGDRQFYLESWNGDGYFAQDRIGRGTVIVDGTCLSLLGSMQPGPLLNIVRKASSSEGDDGFLQRFQVLVWPNTEKRVWPREDRAGSRPLYDWARNIHKGLLALNPEEFGAVVATNGVPCISFAPDAQALFYEWQDALEARLVSDELRNCPAFESHLGKYHSLMPSLALLFHVVDCVATGKRGPISLEATAYAADWAEFLEAHARKIFSPTLNPGLEAARAILERYRGGFIDDGCPLRDIYRPGWDMLKTADIVREGLLILKAHKYLTISKPTGKKTNLIFFNPKTLEGDM